MPPNRISAVEAETGLIPARRNPGLAVSVTNMSVSFTMAWRCNGCAAAPSAGASLIQLRVMAGRAPMCST